MPEYLLTGEGGAYEAHFDVADGPLQHDHLAISLAYQAMRQHGLKVAHLFRADEERWFLRMELP